MRIVVTLVVAIMMGSPVSAEPAKPVKTSVCDLVKHSEKFAGKFVELRAELILARGALMLTEPGCTNIPFVEPSEEDVKPKPAFQLVEDENWRKLESSLSFLVPSPTGGIGRIFATIEGRFDWAFQLRRGRRVRVAQGYGHAALFDSRLVVHRVSAVELVPPH